MHAARREGGLSCAAAARRRRSWRAAASSSSASSGEPSLAERFKRRRLHELAEASGADLGAVTAGWSRLEELLCAGGGGDDGEEHLVPDAEKMRDAEWAELALGGHRIVEKVVVLKSELPGLDVTELFARKPRVLLEDADILRRSCVQAKRMLNGAQDVGRLVSIVPDLLHPRTCASVLATMARWFPKETPIAALERDPDVLRRAAERDQALDPAFSLGNDEDGFEVFAVPGVDQKVARKKQTDWQRYIREEVHGKSSSASFNPALGD